VRADHLQPRDGRHKDMTTKSPQKLKGLVLEASAFAIRKTSSPNWLKAGRLCIRLSGNDHVDPEK